MLAPNPAFETAPGHAPEDDEDTELAAAVQRLPADIRAALSPAQLRRLSTLIAPYSAEHEASYQVSTALGRSRYYFAVFFGKEKRSDARLNREGKKRSFGGLVVRFAMTVWLLSSALLVLLLMGVFALYAAKSVLGIDVFEGHFFMHPLLFKLGLLPGSGA
ncbi:MAG: hypothetical protein KDJ29_17920 [Hyphomicrobiales bacterium]|nr:hypothetical protein [Hyphomicrobiales bacterium]